MMNRIERIKFSITSFVLFLGCDCEKSIIKTNSITNLNLTVRGNEIGRGTGEEEEECPIIHGIIV